MQAPMTLWRLLVLLLLLAVPGAFLAAALLVVPNLSGSMRTYLLMALTIAATGAQLMLAALPVAHSLACTAMNLPAMTEAAFARARSSLGSKVAALAKKIGGDSPVDRLLGGKSKILAATLGPALNQAELLIDVRDFIPARLQDVRTLASVLGLTWMLLYLMFVWPWLLYLLSVRVEVVTVASAVLMALLAILACKPSIVTSMFVDRVESMMNITLQSFLVKLIQTDELGVALGSIGQSLKDRSCDASMTQFLVGQFSAAFDIIDIGAGSAADKRMPNLKEVSSFLAGLIRLDLKEQEGAGAPSRTGYVLVGQ